MTIQHQYIDVCGVRTHYLAAGSAGPVVVLLHGGGLDNAALSWGLLIPELAGDFRIIAPDSPGYGESEIPSEPVTIEYCVRFFSAFLDALAIDSASLVGISMGGSIALGLTLANPQRTEKLVLVDSYGLQRKAPFHQLSYLFVNFPGMRALTWATMRSRAMVKMSLQALLKQPGALTEELVDQVHRQILRPGVAKAWNDFQSHEITWQGTRTCYLDRLGEIRAPTLILHGTLDALVPAECAREANARIPGSRLHWLEGAGHWPQRDTPAAFNQVVKEFLS
jgi:pimeloyl-ACP methyl ester carboxylesterase